ncbi:COQ9 family protein [Amylibacter sp. SFDW26]|uniref:COQ9 family protein n=1 Tax=Amylibacter sp. SFDW26 TaxID=2652722 RepID=UPI0012617254|nr:COQ9 family protein [Amylibacter sp. SFDW26]KAB7613951.1 COQ9 family protein [Amylibacter sp. SFDW26]
MPKKKTEQDHILLAQKQLVEAALPHVMFDGWSDTTFKAAVKDSGVDEGLAAQTCPRGAVDLALGFHRLGDEAMVDALNSADLSDMRFRDKISKAVELRIRVVADEKEAVRRGVTLFALPQNAGEGAQALWSTTDKIWTALGDTSEDVNWYTKRATLSAVYSSTILFWLGDDSEDFANTWAFLDRRIDNVMQFETVKAKLKNNPLGKMVSGLFDNIRKPSTCAPDDLPGKKMTS